MTPPNHIDIDASKLQQAFALHQQGKLAQAEILCKDILQSQPKNFDALHLLGIMAYQNGQAQTSVDFITQAININPNNPNNVAAHLNLGVALGTLLRLEDALASYDRALVMQPDCIDALRNRGTIFITLKRFDDALASFEHALAIQPNSPEMLSSRAAALQHLHRFEDALASYDLALAIQPHYPEALYSRGAALQYLHRFDDALASYDKALAIKPDYIEALSSRGNALLRLYRFDDALASYERALAIKPDYVEAHSNRGNTLHQLNRLDEALASFAQALAIKPDHPEAHWNEALCRLTMGDFALGWQKYEWRWKQRQYIKSHNFSEPLWLGKESLRNKTILLHAEQGLGDTIQFCRYVPLIAALGATVILEVQPSLKTLLRNVAGVTRIVAQGETLPAFDVYCPLLSLPLAFHTELDSIPFFHEKTPSILLRIKRLLRHPATIPSPAKNSGYLKSDTTCKAAWENKLGMKTLPRVGLVWSGNPLHQNDTNRSISLLDFIEIINDPAQTQTQAQFYSLQKELRAHEKSLLDQRNDIAFIGDDLKDFSDTAALIDLMDLVITVDTSIAHLAGAMGKPVWILLPFNADWRWLLDRNDSPWYPSARLFRQPAMGDWHSVITDVKQELMTLFLAQTATLATKT